MEPNHESSIHSRSSSKISHRVDDSSREKISKPPLPWFTESYFSRDPATAKARKTYIIILTLGGVVIIVFALAVLSIYWGSLWETTKLVHHVDGWVVVSLSSDLLRTTGLTRP